MYKTQGNKTKRILNLLRHKARTAKEIIENFSLTNPDTYRVTKRLLGYMDIPKFDHKAWKREEEKRFYMLLAKLRREEIIKKQNIGSQIAWELTTKGIEKLFTETKGDENSN